ncbi:crotonobetainyl-CoA hydratase [Georgenia soli]|uniref:Crotonobetainyl-CoA hydratase n=1 Tax=Georgenia soli TaxID=638953 RepID=A0A2A9F3W9_9MICO|nr:enoyl-CoA hydratase-related protein [Georgenia soli]PFG45109.1 crotonobetainyl-CoA hydratase [Georgenia soli]
MTTHEESGVRVEIFDRVATVTIDRPHVLNAVDDAAQTRLSEVWGELQENDDVWVVVLTGAGERSFCSGSDMSAGAQARSNLEFWAGANPDGYCGLTLRDSFTKPVIARVNGYALGGGMELVNGCDIVIAADSAVFGLVEPRVGRLAFDGTILMTRRMPYTTAMGMLLTGRKASAEEMRAAGLVNEVVPLAELDDAVDRWVQQILGCAPTSVRAIKEIARLTSHMPPRQAARQYLPSFDALFSSGNADEGVQAFREKRSPSWSYS